LQTAKDICNSMHTITIILKYLLEYYLYILLYDINNDIFYMMQYNSKLIRVFFCREIHGKWRRIAG